MDDITHGNRTFVMTRAAAVATSVSDCSVCLRVRIHTMALVPSNRWAFGGSAVGRNYPPLVLDEDARTTARTGVSANCIRATRSGKSRREDDPMKGCALVSWTSMLAMLLGGGAKKLAETTPLW